MSHHASSYHSSSSGTLYLVRLRDLVARASASFLPRRLSSSLIICLSLCLPVLVVYTVPAGPAVTVTLTSSGTRLAPGEIRSGHVRFVVKNDDADMTHGFILMRTDLPADKLPVDKQGRIDKDSPQIVRIMTTKDLPPGSSRELATTLTPGHYVYISNLDTHHMIGMGGEFSVEPQLAVQ